MLTIAERSRLNIFAPAERLGEYLHQKRGVLKFQYSFATHGGAVSSILMTDDAGNPAILPDKAIITQVYFDVITAMTSTGNNGTIALTANTSGDLLAAVDADTLPLTASHPGSGIPVGSAATMVKLTAKRQMTVEIATNALLAGKVNFFVEWVLSD